MLNMVFAKWRPFCLGVKSTDMASIIHVLCNRFISVKTYVVAVILDAIFNNTYSDPTDSGTMELNSTLKEQVLCA